MYIKSKYSLLKHPSNTITYTGNTRKQKLLTFSTDKTDNDKSNYRERANIILKNINP